MTAQRAREFASDGSKPSVLQTGHLVNGRIRSIRASVHLSAQAIANGDTLFIGKRPKGSRYAGHRITSGVTLGATTVALGVAGTPGKYRAAAVFTNADTPTQVAIAARLADDPLADDEDMIATFAAADAPTSDHYLVIETFYTYD